MDELAMLRDAAHNLNDELVKYKSLYTQAIEHLRAVLVVEDVTDDAGNSWCPWCLNLEGPVDKNLHDPRCPRQAAAKWLQEHTDA